MANGRVLIEHFDSKVLQGNYLADPSTRRVAVYLPPGYDNGNLRYPVVFLLVGYTGRGTMLMNESAWDEDIQSRLDRLINSGSIVPMIVVMPDCFTRYGGSQYINSVGTGRYQDHIVEELVPWVDRAFRSVPDRSYRAVMGKSSGGYGSLLLGMLHPETVSCVACHSGDMYFELCYGSDVPRYLRAVEKFGGLAKFLQAFPDIHPKDGDFFAVVETAAMASCYSPNPASPTGFDLPFDDYTGEWREEVWARWKNWDPIDLIDSYAEALRSLRLLYLDCGTRDEFNLQFGARTFCARLGRRGIPYHYEEFDDGHRDVQYRYDVSLKAISQVWGK
jgi:S-formylglutathione hydrolase FrmB